MGNKNTSLNKAKHARSDEFYTSRGDIEEELRHYTEHFRGKTILCNCDDPFKSEFFKYFALNFNRLGLDRLIATCYTDSPKAGRMQPLLMVNDESDKQDGFQRRAYRAIITNVPADYGDHDAVAHADMQSLFLDGGGTSSPNWMAMVISARPSARHCWMRRTSWSRTHRSACSASTWRNSWRMIRNSSSSGT